MPSNSGMAEARVVPPKGNVFAGGAAGVAAVVLLAVAKHYGYDLQALADAFIPPPGSFPVKEVLVVAISGIAGAVAPMPVKGFLAKINDDVIRIARASQSSPASSATPAVDK